MTEKLEYILKSLLGIVDPVSMTSEDRKKVTGMVDFFSAEEKDILRAFFKYPT